MDPVQNNIHRILPLIDPAQDHPIPIIDRIIVQDHPVPLLPFRLRIIPVPARRRRPRIDLIHLLADMRQGPRRYPQRIRSPLYTPLYPRVITPRTPRTPRTLSPPAPPRRATLDRST